ncbi:hypothetical protein GUITHDRAFT_117289 [Guillardia theta CCMP2712]|uniref:Reverse transcriptase domain-containing protein n=1 Tax=Guillardia theta (strain CCMP2712) TaxID=905079 RepID=L1IL34_GUITC|nr:hypothetical protein GUITHDRAFT_117289 [Guillardia theta CCMP2712]EKX36510.1 hypothetical protein GUITHDRAFT_117289 [Guillardia theta CCMP2712]|eukprot:XP_005823490.1 hypothetical protein GUITHDRAFT_117289 [Guillardia theta CCMP2712]
MPDLLIPALSAIRRGGRFIPLSKGADKPGLRPIVIGSAHRRLATKLALAAIRSFLDQHFLSSHPRAIQFGLDRDGCLKFSQTASALLPLHARGDDEDVANPTVLVSLDAKNAFNSLDRQALFDAIEGQLFPSVRVLAYADNVVLVGPLEDAVAATSAMKKYMLADLKLEIQPRESKVYIPSWHQHPDLSQLKKSLKRRLKTQLLHFEASQLRAKVSTLNEELSKLGLVQHGFMFKTLKHPLATFFVEAHDFVHNAGAILYRRRDILTLHSRRTHSLKSQDRVLQSTIFAHFPERDLSHSPMRVSSYYPLKAFPHRYAQMLDCYLHGMPICQCPTKCDGCQRELDPSVAAHHLQTCKRRSSKLPTAHDNLTRTIRSMLNEAGLQSVIDTVGDPRSRRQVPSHPHGRKMKGDIHIPGIRDRGSEQYEGLMADVTLVHPYIGSSADLTKWGEVNLDALHVAASEKIRKHRAAYAMPTPPRAFIPLAISTDGTLHPDTLRFIWYLADIIAQRSMPLEDAAFGRHFVPDDGPAAEVLARKRAATYQRLTMQLTLEALLSGARRMTPLRAQALLEPEDSSSSDFVESPEESSPEVSDSDGGNPSSGPDDRRGAGDSEASPSLTVTSGASGELDTTGAACLRGFALGLALPRLASRCGLCACRFSLFLLCFA